MIASPVRGLFTAALCTLALAGCGGGGGGTSATPATGSASGSATPITAHFSFVIPARGTSATTRRVSYISPFSQSLEIDVAYGSATAIGAQLNLSPLPSTCSVTANVTSCNIAVVAQSSATNFIITFYDQPNSQGNILSTATVSVPAAVNGVADVAATLLPVVASVNLALVTPLVQGQAGTSVLALTPLDADGNVITGTVPFAAPVQLQPASAAIVFTPNTVTSPATAVTVTYTGAATSTNIIAKIGNSSVSVPLPIASTGASPAPTASPTASPTPVPTASPTPPPTASNITIAPGEIAVTVGGPAVPLTVTAQGGTIPVTLTATCTAGAQIALSPTTAPAGTSTAVNVTAIAAPTGAPTHACTVVGTSGTSSASAYVDVNQNSFSVNGKARVAR